MWVKKSPEELQKPMPQRNRILGASAIAAVVFIGITTFGGIYCYGATGHFFHTLDVIVDRTPIGLLISMIVGSLIYWLSGRKTAPPQGELLMCPKCEKTKFDDEVLDCPCGGSFEHLQTMKLVNPSEPSQK